VTCPQNSATRVESPAGSAVPPDSRPLSVQLDELIRSGLTVDPTPELGRGLLPQTPVGPMVVVVVPPGVQGVRTTVTRTARSQACGSDGHRQDGLTTEEREEVRRLRRENKTLREERDILKKAAAWFARTQTAVWKAAW
jgi:hypothetical protein